jgi:hypothetical protein
MFSVLVMFVLPVFPAWGIAVFPHGALRVGESAADKICSPATSNGWTPVSCRGAVRPTGRKRGVIAPHLRLQTRLIELTAGRIDIGRQLLSTNLIDGNKSNQRLPPGSTKMRAASQGAESG